MGGKFDGKEIRKKLKEKGYSVQNVADALGVTRNAVYAKLKNPKYENLEEFASVMEEPIEYFLSSGKYHRNMDLYEIHVLEDSGKLELQSVSKHFLPWLPDHEVPWMGMQMVGDNMSPDVSPADFLIIDPKPQHSIIQDSIYLTTFKDGSLSVNRLRQKGKQVTFINHNDKFESFVRDKKDIQQCLRVVEVFKRQKL